MHEQGWCLCVLRLALLSFASMACQNHKPQTTSRIEPRASHTQNDQALLDAEHWLLRDDASPEERLLVDRLERRHSDAYAKIIKPGYQFLSTNDPDEQTRLLTGAISGCQRIECLPDLFCWAKDEREIVRAWAFSSISAPFVSSSYGADQAFQIMLEYLSEDLPAEYLAKGLSTASFVFCTRKLPEEVLKHLEARGRMRSDAGRYLEEAVRRIRRNGNVLPYELGRYPPMEIRSRPFVRQIEVVD